jgi:uncharacterized iron-regulated protein
VRIVVALAAALAACATAPRPTGAPWQAALGRDHPLTGRIWNVAAERFLDEPALIARLVGARFALLGEKHDHPDHHRLQARVLRALIDAGRRPAVAFEMLTPDQTPALARHLAASPRDAAGLGDAVGWKDSGWPAWSMYQPIAQAALDAGLPIVAANVPTATARALMTGAAAAPPALAARFGLDRALAPEVEAAMAAEMRDAHCGHADSRMVASMITAQRVRDATMAAALLDTGAGGAVLIAGTGHARTDRGVPAYLRVAQPAAPIVSVAFLEVRADAPAPGDYAARLGAARLPFDFAWFTPRVDDVDPCETFRRELERLRDRR